MRCSLLWMILAAVATATFLCLPSALSMSSNHGAAFPRALAASRLGRQHATLEAFRQATDYFTPTKTKEYTLIVVTERSRKRILLGLKQRGFGKGMYNSFGGKLEPGESLVESACRELAEETNITVSAEHMTKCRVGTLHFTFADSDTIMKVYLFRVDIYRSMEEAQDSSGNAIEADFDSIRPCDEITPTWFDDWYSIPLDNMFADDSIWLTLLLRSESDLKVYGHFHFTAGGQDTNTIEHYHVDSHESSKAANETKSERSSDVSLEKRLFHALHDNTVKSPTIKEFKENYAFVSATQKLFKNTIKVVIDVAGSHGALAALYLITSTATEAVVIDPARVGSNGVSIAWGSFLTTKSLRYRHECLRTGLPDELSNALQKYDSGEILVVACHACQHLSDEILHISCQHGVHAAVMPCCQKDTSPGSSWKAVSKSLAVDQSTVLDVLLAGKVMAWSTGNSANKSYDVRMKVLTQAGTPQNRLILCRAMPLASSDGGSIREGIVNEAHDRLTKAYNKAHRVCTARTTTEILQPDKV